MNRSKLSFKREVTKAEHIGPRWVFVLSCGHEEGRVQSSIDAARLPKHLYCTECYCLARRAGLLNGTP